MGKHRKWCEVIQEVREKITKPTAVNKICMACNLSYPHFKRLVDNGVLEFVDNKRQEYAGVSPNRYVATIDNHKTRTS